MLEFCEKRMFETVIGVREIKLPSLNTKKSFHICPQLLITVSGSTCIPFWVLPNALTLRRSSGVEQQVFLGILVILPHRSAHSVAHVASVSHHRSYNWKVIFHFFSFNRSQFPMPKMWKVTIWSTLFMKRLFQCSAHASKIETWHWSHHGNKFYIYLSCLSARKWWKSKAKVAWRRLRDSLNLWRTLLTVF